MKVCLDLHDFSVLNNRLDLLLKLKKHFKDFKVSLFTVPLDQISGWGKYLVRNEELQKIKQCLDWIQIIPHGLYHYHKEMKNVDKETFKHILTDIEYVFKKNGLPFVKGFCAPHWKWSQDVVKVLDKEGWWGAIDPRQPNMLSTKKFYKYSVAIDKPFYKFNFDLLKLHGHIYGTRNDLGRCLGNLLRLPLSVKWHFVTDFLEDKI